MAQMRMSVVQDGRTALQRKLLNLVGDPGVLREINVIIEEEIEPYVPLKTGYLRDNVQIGPTEIRWVAPYARYQYWGINYGPNYFLGYNELGEPIIRTPRGTKKYPQIASSTGSPNLTYHTAGTTAFWYEAMMLQKKASLNQKITYFLKKECERRDL